MKQTYIEWLHPGTFFTESSTTKCEGQTLPATLPDRVAGYRFFSRTEVECDGETLIGQAHDHTPWTYFGTEFTIDQLKALDGYNSILISNIEGNGYTRAVRTIFGNWYHLTDGESVRALPEGGAA